MKTETKVKRKWNGNVERMLEQQYIFYEYADNQEYTLNRFLGSKQPKQTEQAAYANILVIRSRLNRA
jgi:hypothetical protein